VEPRSSSDLLQTGELLARIRRGDRAAGEELFQRYRPRIAAFVRARVRPGVHKASDADDVVQDVCVKIWNALDGFEERSIRSFWWFARTLARNPPDRDLARRGSGRRTRRARFGDPSRRRRRPGPRDAVGHRPGRGGRQARSSGAGRRATHMRLDSTSTGPSSPSTATSVRRRRPHRDEACARRPKGSGLRDG
jgi:hypothetical protein